MPQGNNLTGFYYFAHPYTARDADGEMLPMPEVEEANYQRCCVRSAELLLRGIRIFSPITHSHGIHRSSPRMMIDGFDWYKLDMDIIATGCFDGIILAPGWQASPGCIKEMEAFVAEGKPVFYYEQIVAGSPHIVFPKHEVAGNEGTTGG